MLARLMEELAVTAAGGLIELLVGGRLELLGCLNFCSRFWTKLLASAPFSPIELFV